MANDATRDKTDFRPPDRALMFAVLWGPMVVMTNLTINDSLVASACESGSKLMLHLVTLICFLLCAPSALIGRRYYELYRGIDDEMHVERARWMALLAIALSLSSAVILVAMEVPNVLLRSCQ